MDIQPSERPHGWVECIAGEWQGLVVVGAGMQSDSKQLDASKVVGAVQAGCWLGPVVEAQAVHPTVYRS